MSKFAASPFVSCVAIAFVLAGCQTTGGTAARVAVSGQPVTLGHFSSLNEDCSSIGPAVVRITQEPQHGRATTRVANGYTMFVPANPRHICNSKPTPGLDLVYISEPGYIGSDAFAIDAIYANGAEQNIRYELNVK